MDKFLTYAELDAYSKKMAAWLQSRGLKKGARVAVMMPNVLQYPIAIAAILRAGYTVVNVNPLYTPRELEHQLTDSGSEAIIVLENFANTLQQVLAKTPVKHIVVASMGEMLGGAKGMLVNFVVRNVKKMVPEYSLPNAVRFKDALSQGETMTFTPVEATQRRRRLPAVHRRHHRRLERRHAHPPQHHRQRAADRSLGRSRRWTRRRWSNSSPSSAHCRCITSSR